MYGSQVSEADEKEQLHSSTAQWAQYFVTVEVHLAVVKAYDQFGPCYLSLLSGPNTDTMTALGNLLHPVKLNDQLTPVPHSDRREMCSS